MFKSYIIYLVFGLLYFPLYNLQESNEGSSVESTNSTEIIFNVTSANPFTESSTSTVSTKDYTSESLTKTFSPSTTTNDTTFTSSTTMNDTTFTPSMTTDDNTNTTKDTSNITIITTFTDITTLHSNLSTRYSTLSSSETYPTTTAPPNKLPGWAIALIVILIIFLIIVIIIIIVYCIKRRNMDSRNFTAQYNTISNDVNFQGEEGYPNNAYNK